MSSKNTHIKPKEKTIKKQSILNADSFDELRKQKQNKNSVFQDCTDDDVDLITFDLEELNW